jgi:ribonuclease T2
VVTSPKNFCDYPEVSVSEHSVEKELEIVMPSRAAKSCLERHEWHKHGTCQSLDTSNYFSRAIKLLKNFNESKTVELVRKHIKNSKLKKSDLLKSIDESYGAGASKHFVIICKGSMLTEIQINLTSATVDPKTIDANVTIETLLDKSSKGYIRGCKEEIKIDQIGPG